MINRKHFLRQFVVSSIAIFLLFGCSNPKSKPAAIGTIESKATKKYPSSPQNKANPRNYDAILKGSYKGSTYKVKAGDTLFYIAWITARDYRELAQKNNISAPYSLSVGQLIHIDNYLKDGIHDVNHIGNKHPQQGLSTSQIQTLAVDSRTTSAYSDTQGKQNVYRLLQKKNNFPGVTSNLAWIDEPIKNKTKTRNAKQLWQWPTHGKVIEGFSVSERGNKGVDIAGSRGQAIYAASAGKVVYRGDALRGYGNLIIIKHDDNYLSAYAHNDKMLVQEQEVVKLGQKIATMGNAGSISPVLHFEIRYKGKSVNPLRYLPQR